MHVFVAMFHPFKDDSNSFGSEGRPTSVFYRSDICRGKIKNDVKTQRTGFYYELQCSNIHHVIKPTKIE